MAMNNQDIIILFYLGLSPDHKGRKIEEIWEWDHDRLEYTHNYNELRTSAIALDVRF